MCYPKDLFMPHLPPSESIQPPTLDQEYSTSLMLLSTANTLIYSSHAFSPRSTPTMWLSHVFMSRDNCRIFCRINQDVARHSRYYRYNSRTQATLLRKPLVFTSDVYRNTTKLHQTLVLCKSAETPCQSIRLLASHNCKTHFETNKSFLSVDQSNEDRDKQGTNQRCANLRLGNSPQPHAHPYISPKQLHWVKLCRLVLS